MSEERVLAQVAHWRDELIDLSRRNRLLHFTVNRSSAIEITTPDPSRIASGLGTPRGWRFHYPPVPELEGDDAVLLALESEDPDLTEDLKPDELLTNVAKAADLSRILHTLERRAAQEFMDKGLRVLHLGLGTLEWQDGEGQPLVSPLALVPVVLERTNPREPFRLRTADEDILGNPALAVKLEREFDIKLPELASDDFSIASYLAEVRDRLGAKTAHWQVTARAVLSCFSFHKEVMYRDLLANEEAVSTHPIVWTLALGPDATDDLSFDPIPDKDLDEAASPETMASILDADSTQRKCVVAARDGKTFVMDGPPGTGKSQTIANVIAELLYAGKSVLFVSEKAAALEVVMSRLADCGLGHFVLELHSHKAKRKEVATALYGALSERPKAAQPLSASDLQRAQQRRRELSAYAAAVNVIREPLGISVFRAVGRHSSLSDATATPMPEGVGADLSIESYNEALDAARAAAAAWGPVARGEDFLWKDLADPAANSVPEVVLQLAETKSALASVRAWAEAAASQLALDLSNSRRDAQALLAVVRYLSTRPPIRPGWLSITDDTVIERRIEQLRSLSVRRRALVESLERETPEWSQIQKGDHQVITGALERLHQLRPPVTLSDELAFDELDQLATFTNGSPTLIESLVKDARELAPLLGLPTADDMTLNEMRRIFSLGALASSPNRPDPQWFDATVFTNASAAARLLSPLVAEYQILTRQLAEEFTEDLPRLDVESLYESEQDLTPGLSRVTAAGRRNRKNLKACTRSGKISKPVLALLSGARSLQRLRQELDALEAEHAPILGTYYPGRDRAELDRLSSALGVTEQALAIVGAATDSRRLGEQLGNQSLEADELGRRCLALNNSVDGLMSFGTQRLGRAMSDVADQPPLVVSALLLEIGTELAVLGDALGCAHSLCPMVTNVSILLGIVSAHAELADLDAAIAGQSSEDRELLGELYDGVDSSWDDLAAALSWARHLREIAAQPIDTYTAQRLLESELSPDDLETRLHSAGKAIAAVECLFSPERGAALVDDLEVSFDAADILLDDMSASVADIDELAAYLQSVERLQRAGLGPVIDYCVERKSAASDVPRIVERSLLSAWIDATLRSDDRLTTIRAVDRDRFVAEFQQLDRSLRFDASARVINACSGRRPNTAAGAAGVIVKEGMKKTRHMPVRELLARTGPVAIACKPCFMMSPLTVSQFLPPDFHFDAVLFDEASQMRPSDAINAIYRGDQLVVAGDDKQLPPTSFFERQNQDGGDEWDEEQLDEFESVLQAAKGTGRIPSLPLLWHYRSQHEALITYSNYSFYDGKLITYPGALDEAPDVGVKFFHVSNGVYARGGARDNVVEAREVVKRVLWFAEHQPSLSLGVVALSDAQASRINYELEYARRERPDLDDWFHVDRLSGFFVKNLESVQGDERDVIILSIGYGRDEAGKLTMNFGPINSAGGWRRLNVAVTRARRRVELVSSITAGDIQETGSPGIKHLKRYLDYAQRGTIALALDLTDSQGDAESPFEEEVLRVLRSWGYEAVPQVGTAGYRIDIGIRDPARPGRYSIGIECDGAAYHSSLVARDRDRLRQEVLERLGWTLHRIWGPAWYRGREAEEQRLRDAIERAVNTLSNVPIAGAPPEKPAVTIERADLDAPPEWTTPYVVANVYVPTGLPMDDPAAGRQLETAILKVAQAEGPIAKAVLEQRVRVAWGAGRMGARMQAAFDAALNRLAQRAEVIAIERSFYATPSTAVNVVRRVTDNPDSSRRAMQVPSSELQAAIINTVRDAHTIGADELATRVARIFGWSRRGADIQSAIDKALAATMATGAIVSSANGALSLETPSA